MDTAARGGTRRASAGQAPVPVPASAPSAALGEYGIDAGDGDAVLTDMVYRFDEPSAPSAGPDVRDEARRKTWRDPSLSWLFPLIFVFCFRLGLVIAPRIELYLALVCADLGLEADNYVPSSACRASPDAQRALSSLILSILLSIGVFSALTAGFWSSISDRYGRMPVTLVSVLGITLMDVFILTSAYVPFDRLPFKSWFLAVGGVIEGATGGYAVFSSMTQCYLSDVTSSGSRARQYSHAAGVLFAGISVGPLVGGMITGATGNVLATIWLGAVVQLAVLLVTLIVPESLSKSHRAAARDEHSEGRAAFSTRTIASYVYATLAAPLGALDVLLPRRMNAYEQVPSEDGEQEEYFSVSHIPGTHWDANLLLLSCAYFLETACQAVVPFSLQYTQLVFDWNSETMGYYMTYTSVLRVVALSVVVPLFIRMLHRPGCALEEPLETPPSQPVGTSTREYISELWEQRARQLRLIRDSHFDRHLAIFSAVLSALANFLLGIARSSTMFLWLMVLVALGAASASALNSLSLALLLRPQDAGRMFGAWAVLGTVSSALVGPPLFTWVFQATIETVPSMIFHVIAALQVAAAVFLALIRLRHESTVRDST